MGVPVLAPAPRVSAGAWSEGPCQCPLRMATLSAQGCGGLLVSSRQLLHHECPRCPELPPFGLFGDLEQHMRKQHELFCCKLCLKHLKVRSHPHSTSLGLSGT